MTQQLGDLGMFRLLETRNYFSRDGKLLPVNELESLGMEFEGEIIDCATCLCPYESLLPNDHVNVLIKRYGVGGM